MTGGATRSAPAWTRGRWAYPALFLGSVIESSIFPWPVEFPLLAVMLRGRVSVFPAASAVILGSVVGCLIAFAAGAAAFGAAESFLQSHPSWAGAVEAARTRIEEGGALTVFLAMMTPVPVQITSFAAGASGVAAPAFAGAVILGRSARYLAMAVLVFAFGERVMTWWSARRRSVRRAFLAGLVAAFVLALWASLKV